MTGGVCVLGVSVRGVHVQGGSVLSPSRSYTVAIQIQWPPFSFVGGGGGGGGGVQRF